MNRYRGQFIVVLAGALLLAAPVMAKTTKVSCRRIQAALASGKSADDIAKTLKVPVAQVHRCGTAAKSTAAK